MIAFRRIDRDGKDLITVFNFTPNDHEDYRIGVPEKGTYKVVMDTALKKYGGTKPRPVRHLQNEKRYLCTIWSKASA